MEAVALPHSSGTATPLLKIGPGRPHSTVLGHVVVRCECLDLGSVCVCVCVCVRACVCVCVERRGGGGGGGNLMCTQLVYRS